MISEEQMREDRFAIGKRGINRASSSSEVYIDRMRPRNY